jgi:glycosyltransferase involved in cell wall biosynthesis
MNPRISIIIPCFNHGQFILDAIKSVEKIEDHSLYEIIIINDGSTDELTNTMLRTLADKGYQIIFQNNQGLSAARNNAIEIAKGEYILPLDADNMIRASYVYKGIEVLDSKREISVVYGNSQCFGMKTHIFKPGEFNLQRLMLNNFIDACAVFRKEVWFANNGYDSNAFALCDWEFWLNAAFKSYNFFYIDEILFDYRVLPNSMMNNFSRNKINYTKFNEYLIEKHKNYFGPQYLDQDILFKFSKSPFGFMFKIILKKYFPFLFENFVTVGRVREYILT